MLSSRHERSSSADQDALAEALREAEAWREPPREKRDIKKIALVVGLGALSWVATYVGMLELIEANIGDLSLTHRVIVGFSVAMLMTMIIWLLDQLFAPLPFLTKLSYVVGYVFLTMISVGFGFGFYWKVLESRGEATRSAESAVTQVQGSLLTASSRLDQLQTTLDNLTAVSSQKAIVEREKGTTCPNSRPGDGPRRALRDADASRFSFASDFVKGRATQVRGDLKALDGDVALITSNDASTIDPASGTRNAFMRNLERRLEMTATGFNAFRTDPQLRQIRVDLDERAEKTVFPDSKGGTFACPDPQLQTALRGVVRAIDQLPELGKPEIATVEGSEAVIEAFRRLGTTFYGVLSFKLPPAADELRALQRKAVQSVENAAQKQQAAYATQGGLSSRDYIPLAIAMFVDFCLLLVSIGRPINRMERLIPRMRAAEQGPVYQILSKFAEIHGDPAIREKFEVFRHVVFDFHGDYYVAVPLDASRHRNPDEVLRLQQEAHLLANLFASFEKEKIFSRVVNPLLGTRTIQRKLARQGSKFAGAQAFRVYRFRDGAWSEIILGAVMGAARRADIERTVRSRAAGPKLDVPAENESGVADRVAVGEPIAGQTANVEPVDPVEMPIPVAVRGRGGAFTGAAARPARAQASDPMLASKFGPYAQGALKERIAAEDDEEPSNDPEEHDAPRRRARFPMERAKPAADAEADVEVRVGDRGGAATRFNPDNVVNIAEVRAGVLPLSPRGSEMSVADAPVAAIAMPAPDVAPGSATTVTRAAVDPEQPVAPTMINVRVTERTADFCLPVTDAELPLGLIRVGLVRGGLVRGGLVRGGLARGQLNLDLKDVGQIASVEDAQPLAIADASVDRAIDPEIASEFADYADIDAETELFDGESDDAEDPMLWAAQRFAPQTGRDV